MLADCSLTELDISYNQVGSPGMTQLIECLAHNKSLRVLRCDGNGIDCHVLNCTISMLEKNHVLSSIAYPKSDVERLDSSGDKNKDMCQSEAQKLWSTVQRKLKMNEKALNPDIAACIEQNSMRAAEYKQRRATSHYGKEALARGPLPPCPPPPILAPVPPDCSLFPH